MTKPFVFEELLARVRARLRAPEHGRVGALELSAGGVRLDVRTRRAEVDGDEVELTAKEFTLLETFLRHPGQVLSREQLLSHVWGYDFDPGSNVVDVYVGYLRRKLGSERFETVRGMGYRLEALTSVVVEPQQLEGRRVRARPRTRAASWTIVTSHLPLSRSRGDLDDAAGHDLERPAAARRAAGVSMGRPARSSSSASATPPATSAAATSERRRRAVSCRDRPEPVASPRRATGERRGRARGRRRSRRRARRPRGRGRSGGPPLARTASPVAAS